MGQKLGSPRMEALERVAQLIWWNAGINDPKELERIEKACKARGTEFVKAAWEKVQNKSMWRRMAVAAVCEITVDEVEGIRSLAEEFKIRKDVPE